MIEVSFKTTVELHSGKIGLTKKQAGVRAHNLKLIGSHVYEIIRPVQFKVGEKVGLETVDKYLRSALDSESAQKLADKEPAVAKKKAAARAEAEAKAKAKAK